jgi:hypothetical protein
MMRMSVLTGSQMEELLTGILKCGYADLRMLGQFDEYNMEELIDYLDECGMEIELNNLVWAGVQLAFREVQEDIETKLERMADEIEDMPEDDEVRERIEEILDMNFTLEGDCETYHNYIDSHVNLIANVDIYQEYFQEELDRFEDLTGFSLL